MRVLILTEGGKLFGYGHVARCMALSQGLKKEGHEVAFLVNGDRSICDILSSEKWEMFNWAKKEKRLSKTIVEADFVVIDSYRADRDVYVAISKKMGGRLLMIDDYRRLNYPPGVVVNPSVHGGEIRYPWRNAVRYLSGKDYVILRGAFEKPLERKTQKRVGRVLITMGGADRKNVTEKILNIIAEYCPATRKDVVVGKSFRSARRLEKIKDQSMVFIYFPDAGKMRSLMSRADVAISAGGQTLFELARLGVPTIGVLVSDNQKGNMRALMKKGFLRSAGSPESVSFKRNIVKNLESLQPYEFRKRISKIGMKISDGQGVARIVKKMSEIAKQERV